MLWLQKTFEFIWPSASEVRVCSQSFGHVQGLHLQYMLGYLRKISHNRSLVTNGANIVLFEQCVLYFQNI